jgi:hypothetical protein
MGMGRAFSKSKKNNKQKISKQKNHHHPQTSNSPVIFAHCGDDGSEGVHGGPVTP